MKITDFELFTDVGLDKDGRLTHAGILLKFPEGTLPEADDEQYLTNYNLGYVFLVLKSRLGKEKWEELKKQIMDI